MNESPLSHEMATESRGSILQTDRGSLIGEGSDTLGRESRNASEQPAEFFCGVQGDTGVMDPDSHCDY